MLPIRQTLPPEWAPQSGVQLTWPHRHGDWVSRLQQVEPVFVDIARRVAAREHVLIVCYDAAHRDHITTLLDAAGVDPRQCRFVIAPSNDTWARDHGPITVETRNGPLLLDFGFNGWGGKYPSDLDNTLSARLHLAGLFGQVPRRELEFVLEGGSIEVDGRGSLMTTRRCLMSPARNPLLGQQQIEQTLRDQFGVKQVLWLDHGYLAGDDTDSHIDTLARFCDPHTIAYVACDNPEDEHYAELQAMEQEIKALRDADGQPYRLVPLPWPRTKLNEDGERLPATYANFLIINGAVLVPTYEDPADARALKILKDTFNDREVIAVPCLPLIFQFGSLHCVTMQLPAGVLAD